MVITPAVAASEVEAADIVVIPGAIAIDKVLGVASEDTVQEFPSATVEAARHLTELATTTSSVCTGAFILGQAGLLDGKSVTTHWEDIDSLRTAVPKARVVEKRRWVDEGHLVTSGGISAGISMSLYLVARLTSLQLARATARQMEFEWTESP